MNANEKITKIKKYARIGSKITIVLMVLWVLVLCLLAGLSVVFCIALARGMSQELLQSMIDAGAKLQFDNGFSFTNEKSPLVLCIAFVALTFKTAMYLAVFEHIRRILRDVASHDSPFEQIHVKRLKRIALFIFLGSFVNFISIQINEWIVAFVVLFLALIFDYGCQLQQESDETL